MIQSVEPVPGGGGGGCLSYLGLYMFYPRLRLNKRFILVQSAFQNAIDADDAGPNETCPPPPGQSACVAGTGVVHLEAL